MKKLLVVFLTLACLLSLVACGGKTPDGPSGDQPAQDNALTEFANAVSGSDPGSIECEITVETSSGDEIGATITYTADDIDDIEVEYFNTLDGTSVPSSKPTKTDQFKKFTGKNPVELSALSFKTEYFKNGEYTIENDVFTATVTNASGFFGTEIGAGNVKVEITLSNGEVDEIVITYTVSGASVEVVMTYN